VSASKLTFSAVRIANAVTAKTLMGPLTDEYFWIAIKQATNPPR
jgi:hypothetical protein